MVGATYADTNSLTRELSHDTKTAQYEYTLIPIIRVPSLPPLGITVMDGSYPTLLPFGHSDLSLLYHVRHTVIATEVTQRMPPDWRVPETAPLSSQQRRKCFEQMVADARQFVPALEDAQLLGFLEGPRMVLPYRDHDDARPSIIDQHGDRYISVFSGKVDHAPRVADDVASLVMQRFE